MSRLLSRDDILKADDRQVREFSVPEWGGTVLFRPWDLNERAAFRQWSAAQPEDSEGNKPYGAIECELVARSLCGADGTRLFVDADVVSDKRSAGEILKGRNASVIDRLFIEFSKLHAVGVTPVEDAKKNSDETQSSSSSTA